MQCLYQYFKNGQTVPAVLQLMEWRVRRIMATKPPTFANRSATVRFLSSHGSTHNKGELKTSESRKRKFSSAYMNSAVSQRMWIVRYVVHRLWFDAICLLYLVSFEQETGIENTVSGGR